MNIKGYIYSVPPYNVPPGTEFLCYAIIAVLNSVRVSQCIDCCKYFDISLMGSTCTFSSMFANNQSASVISEM